MNLSELEKQLPGKKRSIKELGNILALRTEESPNYTLLLGAGCSVSSGIDSANTLVSKWRKEFCKDIQDSDEQKKYLKENHSEWYDPSNEYASLFEKKFDLQRHRRVFVETQVDGKIPSIGYAYLTSLVRKHYFHTIFTTNFDDLINEAFYLYSDKRPMICAHDSSIDSVTVTSSRPKIIKLHGDYLFEDIKATARETESLEHNMKAKFIEYAKDFGLIVMGYSGSDRSIMDVLSILLKNDTYFKNGIYWCLRKNSNISEGLKKLLWKDKVYFIEVEGFDELLAELHSQLNKEETIPISTSSISKKPIEVINKLLELDYFKDSNSPILKKAYEDLSKESKRNTLVNLLLPPQNDGKRASRELISDDDLITRIEIQRAVSLGQYTHAISKGKSNIKSIKNPYVRRDIFEAMVRAYQYLGETNEAIQTADELILDQPLMSLGHILKSELLTNYDNKLACIESAININQHSYRGYFKKASILSDIALEFRNDHYFNLCIQACDESLEKDPSLDNPCWNVKFYAIMNLQKDKRLRKQQLKEIIDALNKMNPESFKVLDLRASMLDSESNQTEIDDLVNEIKELQISLPEKSQTEFEEIKFKCLAKKNDVSELEKELNKIQSDYDLSMHSELTAEVTNAIRSALSKDDVAIKLLKDCYESEPMPQEYIVRALIIALLDTLQIDEAKKIFNKEEKTLKNSTRFQLQLKFHDVNEEYNQAIQLIKKMTTETGLEDIPNLSYFYIKNQDYKSAEDICKRLLADENYSLLREAIIVNHELACKRKKVKFGTQRLESLYEFSSSPSVKAAVSAILGNENNMIKELKKAMQFDKTFRFDALRWPVFDEYKDNEKFINAIST